ncbi:MAG: DUF434 domain-containing protein [Candidatus Methanoperedens sp.]|nr:DUF434 domain-containing protein [Candidatus Methanoperedens sp.]
MSLVNAASDIRFLLDRGYPQKSAVGFVCAHYRLDVKSRYLLSRTVLAREMAERRQAKFLPCEKIEGSSIVIDGYNIIIGMESILEKKAYLCDDGVIRDVKGAFRNFKVSSNTEEAVRFIFVFLEEMKPENVVFLFDAQISRSGMLAGRLREKLAEAGLRGEARTSRHVDHDLKRCGEIVASSDGVIIDEVERVVNFLRCVVERFKNLERNLNKSLI